MGQGGESLLWLQQTLYAFNNLPSLDCDSLMVMNNIYVKSTSTQVFKSKKRQKAIYYSCSISLGLCHVFSSQNFGHSGSLSSPCSQTKSCMVFCLHIERPCNASKQNSHVFFKSVGPPGYIRNYPSCHCASLPNQAQVSMGRWGVLVIRR